MKNSTEEIDELIKNVLSEEEAQWYNDLDEQNLLDSALGVYKGKLGWIATVTTLVMMVLFGLSIYCLIQFLNSNETQEMIRWGAGMFGGFMAVTSIKTFHWMQMDKNAIIREMKRLEFQVGVLASKLDK